MEIKKEVEEHYKEKIKQVLRDNIFLIKNNFKKYLTKYLIILENKTMENQIKQINPNKNPFLIIAIIIGVFAIGGILIWNCCPTSNAQSIPLSVLAEKIHEQQVKEITIQGNNIEVALKDGMYFNSEKKTEDSLLESLSSYGIDSDKLKDIMIVKIHGEKFSAISASTAFILPFGIFIAWFFLFYFSILVGLKILKIKEIPKSKIIFYIFVISFLGLFLKSGISTIFGDISNRFILYSINFSISFLIVFLLLKYYFLLSGKKLWQFFLYLVVLNLIIVAIITILL